MTHPEIGGVRVGVETRSNCYRLASLLGSTWVLLWLLSRRHVKPTGQGKRGPRMEATQPLNAACMVQDLTKSGILNTETDGAASETTPGFTKFHGAQELTGNLVTMQILIQKVRDGAWKSAFLTSFRMMLCRRSTAHTWGEGGVAAVQPRRHVRSLLF